MKAIDRGRRWIATLLSATLLVTACSSPEPSASRAPGVSPGPGASAGVGPSSPPRPTGPTASGATPTDPSALPGVDVPAGLPDLPADIVTEVATLDAAATRQAAIAAITTILEGSGVVITDDLDGVDRTPASVYLSAPELALLADESLSGTRLARATFADFATAFGGLAGVGAGDEYYELLDEIDLESDDPAPSPTPDAGPANVDLDLAGVQPRVTAMLSAWVTAALSAHDPSDAELAQLTRPALYLQAFAAQQDPPLDLRQPFAGGDLALDTLETTILVAGLRAMFAYAQAPDFIAAAGGDADDVMGPAVPAAQTATAVPAARAATAASAASAGGGPGPAGGGEATLPVDCDGLKHLIDSYAPLSGFIAARSKESVKNLIKSTIDALFGAGTWAAQHVGAAFKVAGLLFKVWAVVTLYEHAEVKLELTPGFLHKPIGSPREVTAHVVAGIRDDEWNEAKAQRENDPWTTALKLCGRFLGLPVTSDLVDVGEGVKSWVVRWEVTRGLGHVLIPASQLVGPGITTQRLERPLQKRNDHSGEDRLILQVQPEREADHPGVGHREPVTVCAKVVPREPVGGFKTLLGAGLAGWSMASGASAHSALVTIIGGLLTAWYREVAEIKACEVLNVMFHAPAPGSWHGRIRVETEVRISFSSVLREPDPGATTIRMTTTNYDERQLDVTDTFYVSGDDPVAGETSSLLEATQFTHGIARYRSGTQRYGRLYQGCLISEVKEEDHYGTWSLQDDVRATISVGSGGYRISWSASQGDLRDAPMPGESAHVLAILDGDCIGERDETQPSEMYAFPVVASDSVTEVEGELDPNQPDRLAGSATFVSDDGTSTTKVTWDLRHNGPISSP
jgi:hypothetical protein